GFFLALVLVGVAAMMLSRDSGASQAELTFLQGLLRGDRRLSDRLPMQDGRALSAAINQWLDNLQAVFEGVAGNLDRIKVMSRELSKLSGGVDANQEDETREVVDAVSSMTAAVHDASQNAATAAQAAKEASQEADSGQKVF